MKLQYIYVLLGISTLALNIALTVHLFRNHKSADFSETTEDNTLITFRLAGEHNVNGVTTAAIHYDDTIPMRD